MERPRKSVVQLFTVIVRWLCTGVVLVPFAVLYVAAGLGTSPTLATVVVTVAALTGFIVGRHVERSIAARFLAKTRTPVFLTAGEVVGISPEQLGPTASGTMPIHVQTAWIAAVQSYASETTARQTHASGLIKPILVHDPADPTPTWSS